MSPYFFKYSAASEAHELTRASPADEADSSEQSQQSHRPSPTRDAGISAGRKPALAHAKFASAAGDVPEHADVEGSSTPQSQKSSSKTGSNTKCGVYRVSE
jgi:hypothetical protein